MTFKQLTQLLKIAVTVKRPRLAALVLLVVILALFLQACAIDRDKITRTREDLQFLCANPTTPVARELCERVAPGETGPVDLTQPQ